MARTEPLALHRTPSRNWKQLEEDIVRCSICLKREIRSYVDSNGRNGHIDSVKSYSLTTSSSTLSRHLREVHDIVLMDSDDGIGEQRQQSTIVTSDVLETL